MPVHPANVNLKRDPSTGRFLKPEESAPVPPTPAKEAAPAEVAKPAAPAEPLSDRFAILAKKEKALVERDRGLKAREDDLNKREAALNAGKVPQQEFKEKPLQALAKQMGVSIKEAYDIVTQQALNGFEDPATPAEQMTRVAREEIQNLRDELRAEREKNLQDARVQAKAEEQAVLDGFRAECHDFLKQNPEKYELTAHFANGDALYDLVHEHWRQQIANGVPPEKRRVLQLDEAAQYLEEHFEGQVESGLKLKKVSAKVQPAPTTAPAQRPAPSAPAPALSNKLASSSATTTADQPAPWDRAERLKRAIAAGEAHRSK
jgi:hypothetical protein